MALDLDKLHPFAFENLVAALARGVIGPGVQSFGLGPDGGRDAIFTGRAPYPSTTECWEGRWVVQAKFLSGAAGDPHQWLVKQIKKEIELFNDPQGNRRWPDVWIIASNIDPSGVPETGAYDKALALVKKSRPSLAGRFHIWGGKAILDYLSAIPHVADSYRHLLTPGNVISELIRSLSQEKASARDVLRHLVVDLVEEHKNTRLQDAGAKDDTKPGIHELFIDLPYTTQGRDSRSKIVDAMLAAAHQPLAPSARELRPVKDNGPLADRDHSAWFIKAGPGRGKSTIGQYMAQIWRSALILDANNKFAPSQRVKELALKIKVFSSKRGHWPSIARIPLQIELRDYAQWISTKATEDPHGVLSFLSSRCAKTIEAEVGVGLLKRLLAEQQWFIIFDGLDEVPSDLKDEVGREVRRFVQNICAGVSCDALFLITSRPPFNYPHFQLPV